MKILTVKMICILMCLLTASCESREKLAREIIERVFRIPDTDNTDSFEKRSEERYFVDEQQMSDGCEDNLECLPEYTETQRDTFQREHRQIGILKHYPICHLERKIRRLNTNEYEYRPAYYEEIKCIPTPTEEMGETNEICSSLGFTCVQWNKTIHLTRRRYSSDCWETKTMVVLAGCECMWPVHRLGDMSHHIIRRSPKVTEL